MRPWDLYTLQCSFPGDQKLVLPQYSVLSLGELHLEEAKGSVHLTSKGQLESLSFSVKGLSSFLGTSLNLSPLKIYP